MKKAPRYRNNGSASDNCNDTTAIGYNVYDFGGFELLCGTDA